MGTIDVLIKQLQILLGSVVLLSLGYIGFFQINYKDKDVVLPHSLATVNTSPAVLVLPQAQPYEKVAEILKERDIFSRISLQPDLNSAVPSGQLPPNIKLVGIIISNPTQVVLEDTLLKQTQFIIEGQKTVDGINIERIENEKGVVYLNYHGQIIPLHLEK